MGLASFVAQWSELENLASELPRQARQQAARARVATGFAFLRLWRFAHLSRKRQRRLGVVQRKICPMTARHEHVRTDGLFNLRLPRRMVAAPNCKILVRAAHLAFVAPKKI